MAETTVLSAEEHFEALRQSVWARFASRHRGVDRSRFEDAYSEWWARELERAASGTPSRVDAPVAFVAEAVHRVLIDDARARARGLARDEKGSLEVVDIADQLTAASDQDTASTATYEALVHRVLTLIQGRLSDREVKTFVWSYLYLQPSEVTAKAIGVSLPRVKKDRKKIATKVGAEVWAVLAGELDLCAAYDEKSLPAIFSWQLPAGQVSPIQAAQVRVCRAAGGGCFSPSATTTSSSFALPEPGAYLAFVKVIDQAGNSGAEATIPLGYDTTPPPAPALGPVQSAGGDQYSVAVDTANDPGPAPITEVQGEACPADGGGCQPVTGSGSPPDRGTMRLPGLGAWTIAVRSVDAARHVGTSAQTSYTVTVPPPTPGPTATPSSTNTPTPSPTPGTKRRPELKVTRARLTRRRIEIRGLLPRPATGQVRVRVKARGRVVTRDLTLRNGTFRTTIPLGPKLRGAKRAAVRIVYGGDATYAGRATTRTLKR